MSQILVVPCPRYVRNKNRSEINLGMAFCQSSPSLHQPTPRQPGGGTRRTRIRPLVDAERYSQGAAIPPPSRRSPCDGRSLSLIRTAPDARLSGRATHFLAPRKRGRPFCPVICHPPSAIRHLPSAICHFSFPIPHSAFRIYQRMSAERPSEAVKSVSWFSYRKRP